jgi:hypothetical protein
MWDRVGGWKQLHSRGDLCWMGARLEAAFLLKLALLAREPAAPMQRPQASWTNLLYGTRGSFSFLPVELLARAPRVLAQIHCSSMLDRPDRHQWSWRHAACPPGSSSAPAMPESNASRRSGRAGLECAPRLAGLLRFEPDAHEKDLGVSLCGVSDSRILHPLPPIPAIGTSGVDICFAKHSSPCMQKPIATRHQQHSRSSVLEAFWRAFYDDNIVQIVRMIEGRKEVHRRVRIKTQRTSPPEVAPRSASRRHRILQ